MGCLIVQDFKNEAYIPYTVLHIFVLSAFFFFKAWKTTLHGFKDIILPILSETTFPMGIYWCVLEMYGKKSTSTICFFSAKVQEKQNRKLGKFCSTISLEM